MSKIGKWRLEKAKVKVVFRLQFHATHIPQTGWDKLYVSLIPADSGKPTAKTNKASVRNGACKWADPIYETTRLLQDSKTKQYDEKLYKLVVAMGSSRSSFLGEVNINLADYVDALKPSTVSLPLHGCNSGTTLHVTVQPLTSKTGFREFEQQRELREKGLPTTIDYNVCDESTGKISASTDPAGDQTDKANARVRFKSESRGLPSLEEVELNEDNTDSAAAFDGSSNTSESLYTEKHDSSSMQEIESLKSTTSGEIGVLALIQSPRYDKGDPSDHQFLAHGNRDLIHGWNLDYSVDNDLAIAYEENSRLKGSLEVAESSISELKLEVSTLQSHLDEIGVETQNFAEQLAAEMASGEDLAKEVSILKSECSNCKGDLEKIKNSRSSSQFYSVKSAGTYNDQFFQDLQIRWLQGLLVMENKVREIQNKAGLRCHETDVQLLHSDMDALHCVLQDLKQGSTQVISLLNILPAEKGIEKETGTISLCVPEQFIPENTLEKVDSDHSQSGSALHCLSMPCLVSQESDPISSIGVMEGRICELLRELNDSKAERERLSRKMEQMECYYEALIQELEESQKQMLGELQNLRNEHSACLYTISSYKTQMETMHQDVNAQLLRFAEERHDLDSLNKELERRAIASESALKRARWNYSIAMNQLQKDLELLSFQVLSMFETNEKLIRQAFAEASEPCFQESLKAVHKDNASFCQEHLKTGVQGYQAAANIYEKSEKDQASCLVAPRWNIFAEKKNLMVPANLVAETTRKLVSLDCLRSPEDELRGNFSILNLKLDSQISDIAEDMQNKNQISEIKDLDEEILSVNLNRSLHWKAEDEIFEVHVMNTELDVFSKALKETLLEATDAIRILEQNMDELAQQLGNSTESKDLLMMNLQSALNDFHELREHNANCIKKCDDLALQNQVQEKKLEGSFNENLLLSQKIMELENSMMEYRGYKSKYEACIMEKTELDNLLKQEAVVKCNLQNEVSFVREELKNFKEEFDILACEKDNLAKAVNFLEEKMSHLMSTMAFYGEKFKEPFVFSKSLLQDLENKSFMSSILHLEKLLHVLYDKNLQLVQDKKDMEEERDNARESLTTAQSEILVLKQEYVTEIKDIVSKLNASTAHVERLQLVLEEFTSKMEFSLEVEKKYSEQQRELFSKLALMEIELQHVSTENRNFTQKILDMETVSNEESVQLATELHSLEESLMHMHDELNAERGLRAQLEGIVTDLTSQLNEKNYQLLSFERQKSELEQLKQLASDLNIEKSKLCHLLSYNKECLKKADEDSMSFHLEVANLEIQLDEMHEHLLQADVDLILTRNQYEARIQELVRQLEASKMCRGELHTKHLNLLESLNGRVACDAEYMEENARLLTALSLLKSESEASDIQKRVLLDKNNALLAELQECKDKAASTRFTHTQAEKDHEVEVEYLKQMLTSSEEIIDNLRSSRDELEITVIILKAKLDEQHTEISLLEKHHDELMVLRSQHNELSHKLSEQILKTEEFKNLSIHLKELKDKAETECVNARERRETEGISTVMQEPLRIAFIREQYETKVQELRHQLCISKRHGEDMLLKLQDALDEVENRKKSEASLIKRNEELSLKILDLESELQIVLSDKREKIKAYDQMKAELECTLISLDCCKEEKQKLVVALQECNDENLRIAFDLKLTKEELEILKSLKNIQAGSFRPPVCMSREPAIEKIEEEVPVAGELSHGGDVGPTNDLNGKHWPKPLDQDRVLGCEELKDECVVYSNQSMQSNIQIEVRSVQDLPGSVNALGISNQDNQDLLQHDAKHLDCISDPIKIQSLMSSMNHLHEELDRMKNENLGSLLPEAKYHFHPVLQGLQRELLQLHKANEYLGSKFPLFKEFSSSGSALERVLALEFELAEALQSKNKADIHFQSSFLKQHNDEQAIFQSFKDINELIKDMLELKGRYAAVERELTEMHDRYSQLSLQFAEVEGERQKLSMTLKNAGLQRKNTSNTTSSGFDNH